MPASFLMEQGRLDGTRSTSSHSYLHQLGTINDKLGPETLATMRSWFYFDFPTKKQNS